MSTEVPVIRENYFEPNYDPEKIAPYTLEDPLTFLDGSKVTDAASWQKRRREILDIFAEKMLGEEPPAPEKIYTEVVEEKTGALGGYAVRTQYRMYFNADKSGPAINWLVLRPRYAKKPVPAVIFLNYRGNYEVIPDPEVIIPDMWLGLEENYKPNPEKRGIMNNPNHHTDLPVGLFMAAGVAVITACYAEVSPDPKCEESDPAHRQDPFAYTGVFELWGKRDESRTDNTTALGAWAWALSRGMDLAEQIPEIDAAGSVVTGCSRLGKAALIAAARDERFQICFPIQCGGGGVTLAKRDFGENIAIEVDRFSHWYCKAYKQYERNPAVLLDFDQHLLTAAVAPRKLLVAGFDSPWFDTEGEYLSCKAAGCAWEVCGKAGFPDVPFPESYDTSAIGPDLGYFRRTEEHGIAPFDWWQMLRFIGKAN